MKLAVITLLLLLCSFSSALAADWYAAPIGLSTASGSASDPWDLTTALNKTAVIKPGDTLWLKGGTYRLQVAAGQYSWISTLLGSSQAQITVRSAPGQKAVLDGNLTGSTAKNYTILTHKSGGYVTWRDIEITNSEPTGRLITQLYADNSNNSARRGNGFTIQVIGDKVINCFIHDAGDGLTAFSAASDTEVYGTLIYNNGWDAPDRTHGHGIYTQNTNGYKLYRHNILVPGFSETIQLYGSSAALLKNITLDGNTITGGRVLMGGGSTGLEAFNYTNNISWQSAPEFGYGNGMNTSTVISGNFFANGVHIEDFGSLVFRGNTATSLAGCGKSIAFYLSQAALANYTFDTNKYYRSCAAYPYGPEFAVYVSSTYAGSYAFDKVSGSQVTAYSYFKKSWKDDLGLDRTSTYIDNAPGILASVVPNKYDVNLANVTIINFPSASSVKIDVSALNWSFGDSFELRNTQNYFGDVVKGTYDGSGTITVPMTGHTVALPIGYDPNLSWPHYKPPVTTFPKFGAFRLVRTATPPPVVKPPVISSFTASPASLIQGAASALAWVVTGATSVSLDNGLGIQSGSYANVTPAQTTTYTLTATNSGGTTQASVTVVVSAPAPPPLTSLTCVANTTAAAGTYMTTCTSTSPISSGSYTLPVTVQ